MKIKTIKFECSAKLIEKKSSFFAYVFPIVNIEDVRKHIESIRKKHKGCNHVAWAYEFDGTNYSDDGEPSKTAGFPLLKLIEQKKLKNVLICVARIFGGIKLGVGGLRSAYSEAGKLALNGCEIIETEVFKEVVKEINLKEFSKFEKELKKNKTIYSCEFKEDKVIVKIKMSITN